MDFTVYDYVETRSDNSDLKGYIVRLDDKKYILYYDKDLLREVYFIGHFRNYFMSCRVDMKTISHYYMYKDNPTNKFIKRYENGKCNRIYKIQSSNVITSVVQKQERVYVVNSQKPAIDQTTLYNDLIKFLDEFYAAHLNNLFLPNEPNKY